MIATVQGALVKLSEGATVKRAETIALAETTATSGGDETAEQRRRHWKDGMSPRRWPPRLVSRSAPLTATFASSAKKRATRATPTFA
jgi:hypothetical protein